MKYLDMELSITQLEAKHLELKNHLEKEEYFEFFQQASGLSFCNGIARYKKDYLENHFPHGLPHFGRQLRIFISDCFTDEIARLRTQPKIEEKTEQPQKKTTPQQEQAAREWFERGKKTYDRETKIVAFSEAIALKPDYAEAYYNRGYAKYISRRHQDAVADFDKAIAIKPDYAGAYVFRGDAKYHLNKYEEAINDINKALILNPNGTESFYRRALAYSKLKDKKGVLDSLRAAILLDGRGKARAKEDAVFAWLREDADFKRVVG